MKYAISILAFVLPLLAGTQCYPDLKSRGQTLYAQGQYDEAIRHYLGALNCPDRPSPDRDAVPDLIKAALQARVDELNAALDQVEVERQKTEEALAQANKLIDAFYFYADRFALAYKNNQFYFIDKNGDPVEKLGRWERAEQFDQLLGLAKVTRNRQVMLLDTFGNSYPLATEVEELAEGITALDLSDRDLEQIPEQVFDYPELQVLLLRGNELTSLPAQISRLPNLVVLELSINELRELPPEVGQLTELQVLRVNYNQLTTLPPEIGQLQELQSLALVRNEISELPAELGQLQALRELILQTNQLTSLPPEIGRLHKLQTLYITENNLSQLPPEIGWLSQLRTLEATRNSLRTLPREIGELSALMEMGMAFNLLETLPPDIGRLSKLRLLDLAYNSLTALPPEIGQLQELDYLDLQENQLSELPAEIGGLEKLRLLRATLNALRSLPVEIGELSSLKVLELGENQLAELPRELGQLQQLEDLDLRNNRLATIPAQVSNLTQLKQLYLRENELDSAGIPPAIIQLENLSYLDLDANKLSEIYLARLQVAMPWCLINHDFKSINEYFESGDFQLAMTRQQLLATIDSLNPLEHWDLSYYALFAGVYDLAIRSAKTCLELDPTAEEVETNLALGYLLSDQWLQAEAIYQKWKGRPFPDYDRPSNELFLQDIADLESAGITHPDFEKVRELLAE